MIKGLGSSAASFVISMIVGEKIPGLGDMLLIIFREIPGVLFWIALLVMALGVYLNVTEES